MKAEGLYRLHAGDEEKLKDLLTQSFLTDPLYCEIIPSEDMRRKMLPELFNCEIEDLFEHCEIYADSPEVNAIIVVSDETVASSPVKYYLSELIYCLKAGAQVIREDLSLKTLRNFLKAKDFLLDSWTQRIETDNRLHIIYLAVKPECRGKHLATKLMSQVLKVADKRGLMASLETHNSKNVKMYEHFGFEMFEVLTRKLALKQYCMVRKHA